MPERLWAKGPKMTLLYEKAKKRITGTLDEVKMIKNIRLFKELLLHSFLTPSVKDALRHTKSHLIDLDIADLADKTG